MKKAQEVERTSNVKANGIANKLREKLRRQRWLVVISFGMLLSALIVGLMPNGVRAEGLRETIYVGDNLSVEDFKIYYTNILNVDIPLSKNKLNNVEVSPSNIDNNTTCIDINIEDYKIKKLTSPVEVKEIKTSLDDTTLYEGDKLITDDLTVEVIYNDGEIKDITDELRDTAIFTEEHTVSKFKDIEVETKYGTVKFDKNKVYIESILGNIEGIGTDTGVWYEGEKPTINTLTVEYSNGDTRTVDVNEVNLDGLDRELLAGENVYSVIYGGKQLAFCVEAKSKLEYFTLENKPVVLSNTKLRDVVNTKTRLVANYKDESQHTLNFDETVVNTDNAVIKTGKNTFEVEYLGRKYNLYIEGKEATKANMVASHSTKEIENSVYYYESDSIFTTLTYKTEGSSKYYLTHIVVNNPNQLKSGLSYDDFGGTREKPTSASKRLNWVVGANASYFSYDTGEPVTAGVFIRDGKHIKGERTNGNEVCVLSNGTIYTPSKNITAQELLDAGVRDIFGTVDPLLIQNGVMMDLGSNGAKTYPRCAIGMVAPGEYYMITTSSGSYSGGLSFSKMQSIFNSLGCTYARSLDGGGSASLVFKDKLVNKPAAGGERPVTDFIYFTE